MKNCLRRLAVLLFARGTVFASQRDGREWCCQLIMIVVLFVSGVICANPIHQVSLPTVEYVDTEVTTNVTITAWQNRSSKFSFSLSCLSTPSNNVEVAFGIDVDADGVLDPGETEMVVGWDCGSWFVRKGIDGHRVEAASPSTNEIKTLVWNYRLTASETTPRLSVKAEGETVFDSLAAEAPDRLYGREWNLMRLTGRGLDAAHETFTIGITSDPTAIFFR